ncbi:MAG TPA: WAP domain-containing protein [bacterium]|nr:WAP domain-containing protein [bacterium]
MKRIFMVMIALFPFFLSAVIGPNVSQTNGQELKWEEGAWDYFVMFKSLIAQVTGEVTTTPGNPQADSCIDINVGSTFTLTSAHVPPDTNIDRAFLIWIAAQDPSQYNGPTDNSVTLTFTNESKPSEVTLSTEVTSSVSGNLFTPPSFDYEAISEPSDSTGIFTYRVDVTEFMQQIIELGALNDITQTGEALYGSYNVKGMNCTRAQAYLTTSGMVGAWALVFVYTSERISPKKIYFYNGLEAYRFQEAYIDVSGFELPNEAEVRMTMVLAEGDPGLASATTDTFQPAPPEALAISGQSNPNFDLLWNNCNPAKYTPLAYTEVYNSISSIFGWEDEMPVCVGGDPNSPDPTKLEYAIDADTFLLKAKEFPFDQHLKKGDTMFSLKIGANQDQVYTNLLVVSVDTKAPKFDIPANPDTPDGREKNYCSCSTEPDAVCFDRPFYYLIKVQNWGENLAENVTVQDTLPSNVEYEKGTTEIATVFKDGLGTDWKAVDDVDGNFPFATAKQVSDLMGYCDKTTMDCPDTVMIRFVVRPKAGLPKHETIRNSAIITDAGKLPYSTNSNIALRLKNGTCPAVTECSLPPKAQCGGVGQGTDDYCEEDKDCKDGKKCIDNQCVEEPKDKTKDAQVSFGEGLNSPDSSTTIIIPSPKKDLVVGQFYLISEGDTGKTYDLEGVAVRFTYDSDVKISNIRLIADDNGNGAYSDSKTELAKTNALTGDNYAQFDIIDTGKRAVASGIKNNFIIVADVSTNITSGIAGSFYAEIQNKEAIRISDSGEPVVSGEGFEFATFRFEPPEGFIFTKGENDPQVPSFKEMNKDNPVLQVRTKSMEGGDAIKSIFIKSSTGFARFGEGIESVTLILDDNGNGEHDSEDTLIQKITEFENPTSFTISSLDSILSYSKDEQKYLLFKCGFKMKEGDKAKITISKVSLTEDREIAELPVSSKEFKYVCDENDPNSCVTDEPGKKGGCSLTVVEETEGPLAVIIAMVFGMFLVFRTRED